MQIVYIAYMEIHMTYFCLHVHGVSFFRTLDWGYNNVFLKLYKKVM